MTASVGYHLKFTPSLPLSAETPILSPETTPITKHDAPWNVIIYDDPVNLMDYVTMVIMKTFSYSKGKAEAMMLEVHELGASVVWTGERERGELYLEQLHRAQLKAGLEHVE